VFRELIHLAQGQGPHYYSQHLDKMAVVILFRSRSPYEFLTHFEIQPVTGAVYHHFGEQMDGKVAQLSSLDQVEPDLRSRIEKKRKSPPMPFWRLTQSRAQIVLSE
jgi:hypothetical protein